MDTQVSVIMPAYNSASTIDESIQAIISQEYDNWELIIIDDGSSDETYEVCQSYMVEERRIKYFYIQNRGPSGARQYGILKSVGEFIMFCDSDDRMKPDMIRKMVNAMAPGIDMAVCGYSYSFENDSDDTSTRAQELSMDEAINNALTDEKFAGFLWNKIFSRNLINTYDVEMNEHIFFCEDLLFVISYLLHCQRIISLPEELYIYNFNENSLSNKRLALKTFTNILARRDIQELIEKENILSCLKSSTGTMVTQAVRVKRKFEKKEVIKDDDFLYDQILRCADEIIYRYGVIAIKDNSLTIRNSFNVLRYRFFYILKKILWT